MFQFFIEQLALRSLHLADGSSAQTVGLRAALAGLATFLLSLAAGPRAIRSLKTRFQEPIKCDSAEIARLHQTKQATPTMGGLFVLAGIGAMTVCFCDWSNPFLPIGLGLAVALTALGAVDDLIKLKTRAPGLRPRRKLAMQTAIALVTAWLVYRELATVDRGLELSLPLLGSFELGWLFIPLATLVIVGSSNAVNLSDGLDGLAGGCLVTATGALAVVAYASADSSWANYLNIPHIAGAGEMAIVAAAMIGGLLAFLWFNCHPASVFMGDTGSLPLGGMLGFFAIVARQELLLVAIGGVFVVEALSVIVQVVWFRWTRRRVFLCAPLHHHFQLKGWAEDKIVVRFWIAGALCAVTGLATLKAGSSDSPYTADLPANPTIRQAWNTASYQAKKPRLLPNYSERASVH